MPTGCQLKSKRLLQVWLVQLPPSKSSSPLRETLPGVVSTSMRRCLYASERRSYCVAFR